MGKRKSVKGKAALSKLETAVMDVLWEKGNATAEQVRVALSSAQAQDHKDSTIRTILRRLEDKGYVEHDVDGRTFVFRPKVQSMNVAAQAVRGIIERFCDGNVESLLIGLVDDKVLSPKKLKQLAEKISEAENQEDRKKRGKSQ